MNSAGAKRITSKSQTYEREITSHITPGLLLGTPNMETSDLIGPGSVVANLRVMSRKADVVAAVRRGLIGRNDACDRYGISDEELLSWERLIDAHGLRGLQTTRLQSYRGRSPRIRE
jgi:hypothetical protein